ncbi:MAG: hypothetical protein ACOYNZ_08570 [Rhodoferax sp.]
MQQAAGALLPPLPQSDRSNRGRFRSQIRRACATAAIDKGQLQAGLTKDIPDSADKQLWINEEQSDES